LNKILSAEALNREALSLADLIINRYTSEDGGIFERVDVENGKVIDLDCAIDELGDYVQYIVYLGFLCSRKDYVDWGLKTLRLIAKKYQSEKGLFYNRQGKNCLNKNLLTLNNSDTITGLVSAFIYTGSDLLRPIIEKFIDGAFQFFLDDDYFTYGYLFGDKLTVSLSSLLFSGYFIEETLNYTESIGDRDYLSRIRNVINKNLSNSFFLKYGIFQARIPLGLRGACWGLSYRVFKRDNLKTTYLVKDNVYFLFALLRYFTIVKDRALKQVITRVYNRLIELFERNGLIYNNWNPSEGCTGPPSGLALSHSIIELQLDLYHEFGDEIYLQQAIDLTDKWLHRKSPVNVIYETISGNEHYSLLDPNVDFAVNLLKLFDKTGNDNYREKAFNIAGGIIEYFKAPKGYYWKVDTCNGNPLQRDIETKYLGLLLKLFLVLSEVHKGRSIFDDPIVRNLSRDR